MKRHQEPRMFSSKGKAIATLHRHRHKINSKGFTSLSVQIHESGQYFILNERTGHVMNKDNNMESYMNPPKPFNPETLPEGQVEG